MACFLLVALGIAPLAADSSTNAPGVPLGSNELNAVRLVASNSLTQFRAFIKPSNYQLMGFESTNEVSITTNGDPLLVFTVRLSQLTNYQAGNDFNSLLASLPKLRAIVPIMVGTNVRSSTTMRLAQGAAGANWVGGDWGHANVIRNLIQTYRAIPTTEVNPGTVPFAVEIPIPRIWLVGYYDTQQKLVLRSTIDLRLGPITIYRNQAVTQAAMQQMSTEARRYDPSLPN